MNRMLRYFIITSVFSVLLASKASGQIYTNDLWYATDSFSSYCNVPATGMLYGYGIVSVGMTPIPPNDSVNIYINFDDGTDTSYAVYYTGVVGGGHYYYIYQNHTYNSPGTYAPMIIGTTTNNISDTLVMQPITISNSCGNLSGNVYLDMNGNCTKDAGELPIMYTAVKVVNTTTSHAYYAYTDTAGFYAMDLVDGFTYSVTPYQTLNNILAPTCPSTGTASVTVASGTSYTEHFGYDCTNIQPDLEVTGWAVNWREGFSRPITVHVSSNTFCDTFNATVTLNLSAPLSLNTTWSTPPASQTATSATWNVSDISMFHSWTVYGSVYCDTSATQGDTLCATVSITPNPTDAVAANNTYAICAAVNNSYDPNDKQVSPKGWGTPGNIPNGTRLTYIIRFQNTGNDTAYNVTIKDNLSPNLDWSSLNIMEASHTVTPVMGDNGALQLRFNHIYLSDSSVNEPASHGYIIYSIMPKPGLAAGTQITNQANIYFDYNPAVSTNSTLNTIALPQAVQHLTNGSLEALVYPNPSGDQVYIELNTKQDFRAELRDMLGRNVQSGMGRNGKSTISVKDLASGMYMLHLTDDNNEQLVVKINVQH